MKRLVTLVSFSACALLLSAAPAHAVGVGLVNDFQDGTVEGWIHGVPNTNEPTNVADMGPLGLGDNALQISAHGGGGAGSRLLGLNRSDWTGDYTAAGVASVSMDLNNVSGIPLEIWLAMNGGGGRWGTNASITLPANSGWQSVSFSVLAADMVAVGGFNLNDTLTNVTEFRILHSPFSSYLGFPVAAGFLVDNIMALEAFLEADFNEDGNVDGNDFLAWQNGFGTIGGATKADGDANGDGNVDGIDFLEWQNQFGMGSGSASVPEPSTAILSMIGLLLVGLFRRFR